VGADGSVTGVPFSGVTLEGLLKFFSLRERVNCAVARSYYVVGEVYEIVWYPDVKINIGEGFKAPIHGHELADEIAHTAVGED